MHDVLIVTSRNVVTSGGEFSLIKNRAHALKEHWGLDSDLIALCNTNLGVSKGNEAFGPGTYIRRNFMSPLELLSGYAELIEEAEAALRRTSYKAVLLSGVGLPRYVLRIKKAAGPSTLVCADVHGYYGDGRLLAQDEPLALATFHRLAAMVEEYEQKTYLKKFDRIFTVSKAYREFLCDKAGCRSEQFYIVPCATGKIPVFADAERTALRERYRGKYGIGENELLLVYSGGASAWQCLPETVDLFRKLNCKRPTRLLVLSGDPKGVRAVVGEDDDVLIDSYPPADLPKVFCAADCFVMLRNDVPTNHFAYPNKFLEYVAAYRPVITTPYIYDVADQVERAGVGVLYADNVDALLEQLDGLRIDPRVCDELVDANSFRSTLTAFARDLRSDNSTKAA